MAETQQAQVQTSWCRAPSTQLLCPSLNDCKLLAKAGEQMGEGDRKVTVEKREGRFWWMAELEAGTRGPGVRRQAASRGRGRPALGKIRAGLPGSQRTPFPSAPQELLRMTVLMLFLIARVSRKGSRKGWATREAWILQARILEWIAITSSRGSSPPRDQTQVSWKFLPSEPLGKPKNTRMGSLCFLQGIFQTQELKQGFLP